MESAIVAADVLFVPLHGVFEWIIRRALDHLSPGWQVAGWSLFLGGFWLVDWASRETRSPLGQLWLAYLLLELIAATAIALANWRAEHHHQGQVNDTLREERAAMRPIFLGTVLLTVLGGLTGVTMTSEWYLLLGLSGLLWQLA